jgi:hypothetical protein
VLIVAVVALFVQREISVAIATMGTRIGIASVWDIRITVASHARVAAFPAACVAGATSRWRLRGIAAHTPSAGKPLATPAIDGCVAARISDLAGIEWLQVAGFSGVTRRNDHSQTNQTPAGAGQGEQLHGRLATTK